MAKSSGVVIKPLFSMSSPMALPAKVRELFFAELWVLSSGSPAGVSGDDCSMRDE